MERLIKIEKEYLYFPIQINGEWKVFEIFDEKNEKRFEFKIPVGNIENNNYPYDYSAGLLVADFVGQQLTIKGDLPKALVDEIRNSDLVKIDRGNRPKIHFTADSGWINDPNGLVFDGEKYHLYFQYNPFDIKWENMSWGHATSTDLLHWEQHDTVLFPDETGTMFSGCGLKNEREMLGLPKDALVFFYTAAGDTNNWGKDGDFIQKIAYSTDGGKTLTKLEVPYVGKIGKDSRDPKIFWHEESKAYIMAIYVEENIFAILRSEDLASWQETDRFALEKAWECPDLIKIPDEKGGYKWMFWCADGFYFWGEFDGYKFKTDNIRHSAYINKIPYAAQTYSGLADRVVSVSWLRLPNNDRIYTGAMAIPREFTCRETKDGYKLVQKEIRELTAKWKSVDKIQGQNPYKVIVSIEDNADCEFEINDSGVIYNRSKGALIVDNEEYLVGKEINSLELIVDCNILEISVLDNTIVGMFDLKNHDLIKNENKFESKITDSVRVSLFEMEA